MYPCPWPSTLAIFQTHGAKLKWLRPKKWPLKLIWRNCWGPEFWDTSTHQFVDKTTTLPPSLPQSYSAISGAWKLSNPLLSVDICKHQRLRLNRNTPCNDDMGCHSSLRGWDIIKGTCMGLSSRDIHLSFTTSIVFFSNFQSMALLHFRSQEAMRGMTQAMVGDWKSRDL